MVASLPRCWVFRYSSSMSVNLLIILPPIVGIKREYGTFMQINYFIRMMVYPLRADKSAVIRINLRKSPAPPVGATFMVACRCGMLPIHLAHSKEQVSPLKSREQSTEQSPYCAFPTTSSLAPRTTPPTP